jgi:hypothetical protein
MQNPALPLKARGEAEAPASLKREGKETKAKVDPLETLSVTLSADGRVKQLRKGPEESKEAGARAPAAEGPEIAGPAVFAASFFPAETQTHLRFIFGSGLHQLNLEPGKIYSLAELFDKEEESGGKSASHSGGAKEHVKGLDASSMQLRFEGKDSSGKEQTARFTLLGSGRGGDSSVAPGAKDPAIRKNDPQKSDERPQGLEAAKGTEIGSVTYDCGDGLLESLTLNGGLGSSKLGGESKKLTIVRLYTAP